MGWGRGALVREEVGLGSELEGQIQTLELGQTEAMKKVESPPLPSSS